MRTYGTKDFFEITSNIFAISNCTYVRIMVDVSMDLHVYKIETSGYVRMPTFDVNIPT